MDPIWSAVVMLCLMGPGSSGHEQPVRSGGDATSQQGRANLPDDVALVRHPHGGDERLALSLELFAVQVDSAQATRIELDADWRALSSDRLLTTLRAVGNVIHRASCQFPVGTGLPFRTATEQAIPTVRSIVRLDTGERRI